MNERIKELAEQATTIEYGADRGFDRVTFDKEKFADLIRADERERAVRENAYVQAEREACAKVCEEVGEHPSLTPRHCAAAIRARGNT